MASGSTISFAALVAARAAAIANSVIVVRALGFYDMGVLSVVALSISMGAITANFGIPPAIVKFLSSTPRGRNGEATDLFGAAFTISLLATASAVAGLAALAPVLAIFVYQDARVDDLILLGLAGVLVSSVLSPFFALLQAYERIREMSTREIIISVASVPVTYLLVTTWGLFGAVLTIVGSSLIALAMKTGLIRETWAREGLRLKVPSDRRPYSEIVGFALPAFASAILVTPVLWFGSTLLATTATFVEVGRYAIGYGLAAPLMFIATAIGVPFLPVVSRLYKEHPTELPGFLIRTMRITIFVALPPAVLLMAVPETFLEILYGSSYVGAASIVRILTPAMVLYSVSSMVGYAIAGTGRMWQGLVLNLLWASVFVALCVVLIGSTQEIGLALAYLGAYAVQFIVILVYSSAVWSLRLKMIFVPLAIAALPIASTLLIASLTSVWRLPLAIAVFGLLIVVEFTVMSRQERDLLVAPARKLVLWLNSER